VPHRRPRHKVSRRFGVDVYGTGGEALRRRLATPPGASPGMRQRKPSTYGVQLHEKQKARAIYGVDERQFRRTFEEAGGLPGARSENLLVLLERRLDNVVYRLGFARTRPMARQLVSHGHVRVDGERVTIPSYRVRSGQVVGLTADAAGIPTVTRELDAGRPLPAWLERLEAAPGEPARGRLVRDPDRSDIDVPVDESLVVAFYAR
jgi:small subunit ribosomal protein S4